MNGPSSIKFRLTGIAPLILHSGRLADPLDPATKSLKEISSRRKKTDTDLEELARREWIGGLYLDDSGAVCMPGENIEAMILEASAAQKLKKIFKAGVFCDGLYKIEYDGPKDIKELWQSTEHRLTVQVRVMSSRVMRTRPLFKKWSIECEVNYFPEIISRDSIITAIERAGVFVGLGDWRPRYGRFGVEVV